MITVAGRCVVSVLAFFLVAGFCGAGSMAAESESAKTEKIVEGNSLLAQIHQRDPARAISLISEILDRIALLDRRKSQGNDAGGIPLRRRDADPPPPPIGPPDDRTKKDLQENPILRDLYSRSPLASLRMLQRMREAAGRPKSASK